MAIISKEEETSREEETREGQTNKGQANKEVTSVVQVEPLIHSVSEGTRACDFNFDPESSIYQNTTTK